MSSSEDVTPYSTPEDVRQNLHLEDWDSVGIPTSQVEYYIQSRAAPFVAEELGDVGHADWRLTQIEALLAAHWMAMSNEGQLRQKIREATTDGASAEYTGNSRSDTGLDATTMGQSAIELDSSGTLREIADDEQTDFWHVTRTS